MKLNQALTQLKLVFVNPVLDKEYRLRMRSARSMWTIFFYLFAIGLFSTATFLIMGAGNDTLFSYNNYNKVMFIVLSFAQLGLVSFMAPGLTAGAVSGEREKQTLNLLLTTQQSSMTIIISKLFSSLSFMMLIVFSTLPIYGIVFLYGGISPSQLFAVFLFYLFLMLVIGSIGIMFSTIFQRTMQAVIVTYGVVLFMFIGTGALFLILANVLDIFSGRANFSNYAWIYHILALNPGVAMYSIFEAGLYQEIFGVNSTSFLSKWINYVPMWLEFVIIYALISILALRRAIVKLRPRMKKR